MDAVIITESFQNYVKNFIENRKITIFEQHFEYICKLQDYLGNLKFPDDPHGEWISQNFLSILTKVLRFSMEENKEDLDVNLWRQNWIAFYLLIEPTLDNIIAKAKEQGKKILVERNGRFYQNFEAARTEAGKRDESFLERIFRFGRKLMEGKDGEQDERETMEQLREQRESIALNVKESTSDSMVSRMSMVFEKGENLFGYQTSRQDSEDLDEKRGNFSYLDSSRIDLPEGPAMSLVADDSEEMDESDNSDFSYLDLSRIDLTEGPAMRLVEDDSDEEAASLSDTSLCEVLDQNRNVEKEEEEEDSLADYLNVEAGIEEYGKTSERPESKSIEDVDQSVAIEDERAEDKIEAETSTKTSNESDTLKNNMEQEKTDFDLKMEQLDKEFEYKLAIQKRRHEAELQLLQHKRWMLEVFFQEENDIRMKGGASRRQKITEILSNHSIVLFSRTIESNEFKVVMDICKSKPSMFHEVMVDIDVELRLGIKEYTRNEQFPQAFIYGEYVKVEEFEKVLNYFALPVFGLESCQKSNKIIDGVGISEEFEEFE